MSEAPPKPALLPIAAADVDDAAAFLHQHMNSRFSAGRWADALRASWASDAPNHGFMLRAGGGDTTEGDTVGVLCALYSEQQIGADTVRICNPHSWCVLPAYRGRSVGLVSAVIRQQGYHFTMFSPNADGEKIFAALGFEPLPREQRIVPNLPLPGGASGRVIAGNEAIAASLSGFARRAFDDHVGFPWLRFLGYEAGGETGYLVYRVGKFKRLACANLLHISNPPAFAEALPRLRRHVGLRLRLPFTRFQVQLLGGTPVPGMTLAGEAGSAKFYRSDALGPTDIRQHYSELLAMEL